MAAPEPPSKTATVEHVQYPPPPGGGQYPPPPGGQYPPLTHGMISLEGSKDKKKPFNRLARRLDPELQKARADAEEWKAQTEEWKGGFHNQNARAEGLLQVVKYVDASILTLAEKWKAADPEFHDATLKYSHRNGPNVPQGSSSGGPAERIVDVLIQAYERQMTLKANLDRREGTPDGRRQNSVYGNAFKRDNSLRKGAREGENGPSETYQKQAETIKMLKHEVMEVQSAFEQDRKRRKYEFDCELDKQEKGWNERLAVTVKKMESEKYDMERRLRDDLSMMAAKSQEIRKQLLDEKADLQKKWEQRHLDEKEDIRNKWEQEMNEAKLSHVGAQEELHQQIAQLERSHDSAVQSLHDQMKKMEEDHATEHFLLKERHEERETELEYKMEAQVAQLEEKMEQRRTEYERNFARMSATLSQKDADRKKETQAMEQTIQTARDEYKQQFDLKRVQISNASQEKILRLQEDVKAYSVALLARDNFRPMSETEIRTKFNELAVEIKALAKLEWKVEQKVFDIEVVESLSKNTRQFKVQILQEMIWEILHKHMLCSPFRALGEEGEIMEAMWNEAYGADPNFQNTHYTWPKLDLEAERWRYINVKECDQALRQPISSEWDPRSKLKLGFMTSLEEIRKDFASTVGELVDLEKSHTQSMDKVTKKAAKLWLELGMQRCRFMIVFGGAGTTTAGTGSESVTTRFEKASEEGLTLVTVPELKRYGTLNGLDLEVEASVGGCGGEMIEMPPPVRTTTKI